MALLFAAMPSAPAETPISFNRDIRPILSENCFYCHGMDPRHREAELRLDEREGATRDLGGYSAIVPGKPEQSELLKRLTTHERDDLMPPPKSNRTVSPQQIDLLKRWIAQGAPYETHWAFIPPKRPALPPVQNESWIRQPLDRFILARLEQEGLKPSPDAAAETWLRRASLDLIGLPPTPSERDAFLSDVAAHGEPAYSRAVQRLLASPHYGERQALEWLDVARYADTHGFNNDALRNMWRWREWVIDALNQNIPYSQFLTEQLAGDLLPNPSIEQRLATGFCRNHVINSEGGIINEEYRVEYVSDRVRTLSTAWLGLTAECARCHDHKYDPLSQRDYYRLFAFFNQLPEFGEDGRRDNATPIAPVPTREQQNQLAHHRRHLAEQDAALAEIARPVDPLPPLLADLQAAIGVLSPTPADQRLMDAPSCADGTLGNGLHLPTSNSKPLRSKPLTTAKDAGATMMFWIKLDPTSPPRTPLLSAGKSTHLFLNRGELLWTQGGSNTGYRRIVASHGAALLPGEWRHITLHVSSSKGASGIRFFVDGLEISTLPQADGFDGGGFGPKTTFEIGSHPDTPPLCAHVDELRFFPGTLAPEEIWREFVPGALSLAQKDPTSKRHRQWIQSIACSQDETTAAGWLERCTSWEKLLAFERTFPTAMIMADQPEPRPTFILKRGAYDAHGEPVDPGVPETFLVPWPEGAPRNRLGLARWLTQPQHPLTARVVVNRFWAQCFGTGIVKTLEDFGSQSEWPSHPELLDWLAREFIEGGWNVKTFLQSIVLSSTYRQSSALTPDRLARDPENRLLARGPRFRLPAELLRDQALFLSGSLSPRIGGPSVYPYQPAGLYSSAVVGASYPGTTWNQGRGEDLRRRSLYTFWKRTITHPFMLALDAPDREFCTVRRSRTNTPLQALSLWNETGYLEASRLFASRLWHQGGTDDASRLHFGFRLATGRSPEPSELHTLQRTLDALRADFAQKPKDAEAFLKIGETPIDRTIPSAELAAWTALANVLLNLDETLTKN